MKIVIVGDGKIGSTLAQQLSREGHEITIIDRSGAPLQQTGEDLDILCVEGNGATYATQLEAGVDTAQLLIAVTASDELNLLCCLIAKKAGAQHTIARVRSPEYVNELPLINGDLGLSLVVNPELTCASEIARTLRSPSAIKTDPFADGRAELFKFRLPADSPLAGKTLTELPGITRARVLVCAVERGEEEIAIPAGSFRLQADDRVSFVAGFKDAQAFFKQIRLAASPIRQALLVGGGRIAYYLARQLLDAGIGVKILESNLSRCEQLSALLPKAMILHGDGTNEKFLLEAGLAQTDAFASLTGIDEENVFMSLFVRKSFPRVKVATKIDRESFRGILAQLDLGSVFSPRVSASNRICRYARAMQNSMGSNVETLYKLLGDRAEALEFRVAKDSAVCGVPLQKLPLRRNLLIGCINRAGKILIPSGQDTIEPGDTVVVVTSVTGLSELDDILERRK
jgi:trk system potassium uptake protein TrkA